MLLAVLSFLVVTTLVSAGTVRYIYDDAGRLIEVQYGQTASIRYEYDPMGNLTKVTTQGQACQVTFPDVPPGYWAFDHISAIACAGYVPTTGNFGPSQLVTRGDMAAYLMRARYGENFTFPATPYFTDVPATHPYFKYVQRLKADGLTVLEGVYRVDEVVSRAVAAIFIVRTLYTDEFAYSSSPYFSDVPPTHSAFKWIQKLKDTNLTRATGTFNHAVGIPRDQTAVILARAFLGLTN